MALADYVHIRRLLGWGRVLARNGALRGIERDANTPAAVRRLCRIARLGTIQPATPDYSRAFRTIGPAAIKLGQTLATRPDLVGEAAARNLLALQDRLPPVPFAAIRREIETSFERPLEALFAELHGGLPELVEHAQRRHVCVASPTTLFAILHSAASVIKDGRTRAQAEQIRTELALLAADFGRFDQRLESLGRHHAQMGRDIEELATSGRQLSRRFRRIEAGEPPG